MPFVIFRAIRRVGGRRSGLGEGGDIPVKQRTLGKDRGSNQGRKNE